MLTPGDVFAGLRIRRLLGLGATSAVYEVEDERGAPLALKVLHEEHRGDEEQLRRFVNEALPIQRQRLSHPGLPRIVAVEVPRDHAPYIIMERLGESLAERLRRGPLPYPQVLGAAADLAEVLAYLHQRQIVHRDVKAGNVLVPFAGEAGPLKLIDLGLARLPAQLPTLPLSTAAGQRCGSAEYRAPEQWLCAKQVSDRADVYSLGVLIYELLTGALPFTGSSPGQLRLAHALRPAPPLPAPEPLRGLYRQMLAKAPQERPAATALAAALRPLCPRP